MKTKSCGIYKIINTNNNKIYIGSSINIENRWAKHISMLRLNKHPNEKLQRSWNKHGESSFKFEIILLCEKEQLIEKEQLSFSLYSPEYNIDKIAGVHQHGELNGQYGKQCSETTKEKLRIANSKPKSAETKAKMREARAKITAEVAAGIRPKVKQSEEARKAHSERCKGSKPDGLNNKGNHHSVEAKAKISAANSGRIVPKELRKQISEKLTGVPLSDERKKNMSKAPRPKQSPEQIAKRVAARKATLEKQNRTH